MLADATVERLDPNTVKVRWTWSGKLRAPVTIVAGTTLPGGEQADGAGAAGPDAVVTVAEPDADGARLQVPVRPRHVFVVRAEGGPELIIAERRVAVEGTLNFRDLGGYRGMGGRRVRWGRVYRSDNLASLGTDGWSSVAGLGLRAVYDLRHDAERERSPSRIPDELGISERHLPIGGEAAEAPDLVELLKQDASRYGLPFMIELNRTLLGEHAAVFGALMIDLADVANLPAMFHCTAGKDRTGVAAALLLSALGVDRETVLDDYELTTSYRSVHRIEALRPRLEEAGVDVEQVRAFLSAPRPALATALAEIDRAYGTIDRYLEDAAGVDRATLVELQAVLLDAG